MQIQNFIRLIGGELQNNPLINSFENIIVDVKKISRGDIFISNNKDEIKIALENGAYGVVYEGDLEILDDEVAWIKVNATDKSLIRFLRFFLEKKEISIYYLTNVEFEILKSILNNKSEMIFLDDVKSNFYNIIQNKNSFIFSNDKSLLESIYPEYKIFEKSEGLNITNSSLFKTSLIYQDDFFQKLKLAKFHIKILEKIIYFCNNFKLDINLKKINFTSSFYPFFIDKNLNELHFGESSKVLIFDRYENSLDNNLKFLQSISKWAKIKLFKPRNFEELKKLVQDDFNYALVYGDYKEFKTYQNSIKISSGAGLW